MTSAGAKRMRQVLLLSYHWPPDFSVGTVRSVKLVKHLSLSGWQPVVVTVRPQYYEILDPDPPKIPADIVTVRTRCLPNPRKAYMWLKQMWLKFRRQEAVFQETVMFNRGNFSQASLHESPVARAKRIVLSLIYAPDQFQGWLPFAVMQSLVALRRYGIEHMITIGPPFTAHVVGLVVKKLSGVYWVADFRDPWSFSNPRVPWVQSGVSMALDRWLETAVINNCDRVISVTPAISKGFVELYGTIGEEKYLTITNGFDRDDFHGLMPDDGKSKFTISYVGDFLSSRSPEPLLKAVSEMMRDGVVDRSNVEIRFVGMCRYACGRSVNDMITMYGLEGIVEIVDLVPRRQALQEMLRAHVLMLLVPKIHAREVPAKTYEYIAAGGHILALAERGAAADLVERLGGSAAVSPDDGPKLKQILLQWYEEYQTGKAVTWSRRMDVVQQYDWCVLGRRYAAVLEDSIVT